MPPALACPGCDMQACAMYAGCPACRCSVQACCCCTRVCRRVRWRTARPTAAHAQRPATHQRVRQRSCTVFLFCSWFSLFLLLQFWTASLLGANGGCAIAVSAQLPEARRLPAALRCKPKTLQALCCMSYAAPQSQLFCSGVGPSARWLAAMPRTLPERAARRWHARASGRTWYKTWMSPDPCTWQGLGMLAVAVLRAAFPTWEAAYRGREDHAAGRSGRHTQAGGGRAGG